ncbi:MAG: ribonucleoside triphosphate reductase [Patescibacteria group bacterium]
MKEETPKPKCVITKIKKRDGSVGIFEQDKITAAIFKAAKAKGGENWEKALTVSKIVTAILEERFGTHTVPTVEQIQDVVENTLIKEGHDETAKAYILYREQRKQIRDIQMVDGEALMEDYIGKMDWRVNENGNMSFSVQGLNNYVSSAVTARYWLNKMYPEEIREAHINADLHLHDLGLLAVYCCGWDLKDLLAKGFGGAANKVTSSPPKHFRVALGQLVNFLYTLQGEAAGAQAVANFDTLLAPFIRYDKLSYKEVKQSIQEFLFNLNVPTRVGFQTPFTNITMDVKPTGSIAEENVVVAGEIKKEKYGDFQEEMNMINQAFAESMLKGDADGRIFAFPIPTYNISKDFDWDNPALAKVWEMTAKYGVPYFSNFINSDMDPDDARSMCCRLRLDNRELRKRGGGLFGANPMTGSIGVVTINMARIGHNARGHNEEELYKQVDKLMDLAKESMEIKRKVLEDFTDKNLYPYAKYWLSSVKERFGEYWKNHFNTIGLNGVNECLVNYFDKDITTEEGRELAIRLLDHMRDRLVEYQEMDNNLYNLEATPAEGATYRFAKKDQELYSDMIFANQGAVQNEGAKPYYTNSTHIPVGKTDDIFEALDLQDDLQTKYTGGTVLHGFIGEKIDDPEACKNLVRKIAENYKLPYYTITPTFSICPKHGYLAGEHFYCPKCDEEIGYKPEEKYDKYQIKKAELQKERINN